MRLPRPSVLVLGALLLCALLAALAGALGVPQVTPAQASLFEGQGDVQVQGLLSGVHRSPAGWQALLHRDGVALSLRADLASDQAIPVADGEWVQAQGRIARSSGTLTLLVSQARATAPPPMPSPGWDAIAQDPANWDHRPLHLLGWSEKGELRDHDSHAIRLASGAWPSGAIQVDGYLEYDAGCLCHRLHGHATAWTPAVGT